MIRKSDFAVTTVIVLSFALFFSCGKVKTPSRDNIPLIKERLAKLQVGVLNKNAAEIDSVLSVDILKRNESSDSLLKLVFGPDGSFAFESFGQAVIVYTDKAAQVECYIMDKNHLVDRPLTLTFTFKTGEWLLNGFRIGHSSGDSI